MLAKKTTNLIYYRLVFTPNAPFSPNWHQFTDIEKFIDLLNLAKNGDQIHEFYKKVKKRKFLSLKPDFVQIWWYVMGMEVANKYKISA